MTDTCDRTGKHRHPTPQAAAAVSDATARRGGPKSRIYRCDHCAGWHLSAHTGRQNRLLKAAKRQAREW